MDLDARKLTIPNKEQCNAEVDHGELANSRTADAEPQARVTRTKRWSSSHKGCELSKKHSDELLAERAA
jgi:hypothetical protein